LRLYFRSDYDDLNRLEHPIFPEQDRADFKRLILRMSGNDAAYSLYRDVLIQRIAARMGIDTQDSRTAIVYINGEFWGVHHVRERFDDRYLENVYGVNRDAVDMLELDAVAEYGTSDHYLEMLDHVRESGLKTIESVRLLETMMDVDDFFAYQISQIFFDNTDWPHNNVRYWRNRQTFSNLMLQLDMTVDGDGCCSTRISDSDSMAARLPLTRSPMQCGRDGQPSSFVRCSRTAICVTDS
jgi:hypothetical protein